MEIGEEAEEDIRAEVGNRALNLPLPKVAGLSKAAHLPGTRLLPPAKHLGQTR